MKKLTGFLFALILLTAGMANAGERAGAFSISPYVGGFVYDDHQQANLHQNRPVYGVRLGYDFTDRFAAELVGNFADAELKEPGDRDVAHWNYRLDLLYNMFPRGPVVPYLAVGGGGSTIRYYKSRGGEETDGTFNVGLGFKFFVVEDVAIRLDARHIFDYRDDKDTIHNWEYSMGLSFVFGGHKAAAEEVAVSAAEPAPAPAQVAEPAPAPAPPEPVPAAEPTPGHYKYCTTLNTQFDVDRAEIRPQYRDDIARVAEFMKKYPSTTAVIEGHTDNVGNAQYNMQLSQRRAESVVNYLVDTFGIERSRLTARGYGMTRPIADNATEEGKQKNRRIEAVIDCAFDVQQIQPSERLCMYLVLEFDTGKANVKPQYRNEVAKVADFMKKFPTTTAVIEGHTDNTGSPQANMKLSQQRAENVVNMLADEFGIERSRLSAKGYGSTRSIAYNGTPEGRALNRRINAVIDCPVINK